MKETTAMSRTVKQLEKMYNVINLEKFNGELPTPIITVQSSPKTYGHCTKAKIWKRKDEVTFELNIASEALNLPIEETIDTLIHEMIHLYCRIHDIKETSRGGSYHNKIFRDMAIEKGLNVINTGASYGWNTAGSGNEHLIKMALNHDWNEFKIWRETEPIDIASLINGFESVLQNTEENQTQTQLPTRTRISHIRKYQCPQCKNSVRASKQVNIMCGDCLITMKQV